MAVQKLKEFLENHKIKYHTVFHPEAFTAQEVAASAHITGKELAKTVMVKIDGKMAMAVIPATKKVDFNRLKEVTGASEVQLAREEEFKNMFPGCDIGAMPPFGNLYGLDVYVAENLSEDKEIACNAGSHTELIKLSYSDYDSLVHPKIARISH